MNKYAAALTVASALAISACAKKAPEELPPPPQAQTPTPTPAAPPPQSGPTPGSQAHFAQTMSGRDTIYFDTDRYNIDSADIAALQSQARWLARHPNRAITVEGHADERGTRDYNLALGERRANAAKNYLVGLGVAPARITTVSHGKERPVAVGSDEASWARNRRAVTMTVQ